jgi:hypothetical protein
MFIFERPLQAVLAGLAVAFLVVWLDRLCHPRPTAMPDRPNATAPLSACAVPAACGIVRAGS